MLVHSLKTYNSPSFKANKTSLYADFDGTFIPQSIAPIKDNSSSKNTLVSNYNKYFQAFQEFIDEKKGLFDIRISTGRKYSGIAGDGFLPTYNAMKNSGVIFPKLEELITAEGGDIYKFNSDGTLSEQASKEKLDFLAEKTGWKRAEIDEAVKKIAGELGIEARAVDIRSSHKLSLALSDEAKLGDFWDKFKSWVNANSVKAKSKISAHVYEYLPDGSRKKINGIKAEPLFDGHSIHKDFDIKAAIERAIKEKDFIIAAGDADNDKEMLNLFNYAGSREIDSGAAVRNLSEAEIKLLKEKIAKLPIGIVYVDHLADEASNPRRQKFEALSEFIREQQKLFPDRVKIIKKSDLGQNNTLVGAVKELIASYFKEESGGGGKTGKELINSGGLKKVSAVGGAVLLLAGAIYAYSKSDKE